ncbi:MAG: PqiC family protein [Myxococcota bacterium]
MRSTFLFALLSSVLVLGACSSPSPEPSFYLLRGEAVTRQGAMDPKVRVGLGRVIVAPYLLANPGLFVETAPGEVRPARQHQWAEPLDAGLRWFLRTEIARALGYEIGGGLVDVATWDYTIDVYVARLHGTMTGDALIDAAYTIRSAADRKGPSEYQFSRSAPLPDEGYAALAAAERELLGELGQAIARSLEAAIAPPPGP